MTSQHGGMVIHGNPIGLGVESRIIQVAPSVFSLVWGAVWSCQGFESRTLHLQRSQSLRDESDPLRRFSQQFYLSLGVGESLLASWQAARTSREYDRMTFLSPSTTPPKATVEQWKRYVLQGNHVPGRGSMSTMVVSGKGRWTKHGLLTISIDTLTENVNSKHCGGPLWRSFKGIPLLLAAQQGIVVKV